MSKFKNSILSELGIKESHLPPHIEQDDEFPGIDPADQNSDMKDQKPSNRDRMMSPTAVMPQVLAISVKGSTTGGLPSGNNLTPSKLGGYEPIPTAKENSLVVDKTPESNVIKNPAPIANDGGAETTPGEEHPHQTQTAKDQPPQAVTGADAGDESSLQLKAALPQGIDVDVAEGEDKKNDNEGKCAQCGKDHDGSNDSDECPSCKAKNRPDRLSGFMNETKGVPTNRLYAVRKSLQEKAQKGTMTKKESEVFSCITEVLQRRGFGLEKKMFGKKTMLETAGVMSEKQLPHEELAAAWEDDKNGEYVQLSDKGDAWYVAHGKAMEQIVGPNTADSWKFRMIRTWFKNQGISLNIWHVNERGNLEMYSSSGTPMGGLV